MGRKSSVHHHFKPRAWYCLKIISEIEEDIPIYFLNSGYHFPETIEYKEYLSQLLNLNVADILPKIPKSEQKDSLGRLLFSSDQDRCCYFNKVLPLETVLKSHDVWISGIRKTQTENRSTMKCEEPGPFNTTRFHPILAWTNSMVESFIDEHRLPRHPLEQYGYKSIGCEPCTRKLEPSKRMVVRNGRWFGLTKTECGLHTELRRDL